MKNSAMTTICKQLLIWLASLHMAVEAASAYVAISNVVARQRSGTQLVDITYDLHTDHSSARVGVAVHHGSFDPVEASSFSGDGYGDAVVPGEGKRIVWNAGADMEPFASPDLYLRIQATTRFVVHGDVVEDRSTGLMWTKDVTMGLMNWGQARSFCTNLVYGGYSDWDLVGDVRHSPVFEYLFESVNPFENVDTNLYYWGYNRTLFYPNFYADVFRPGRSSQAGTLASTTGVLGVWPVRGEPVLVNETFEALSGSVSIDYESGPAPMITLEYSAAPGGMICGPAHQEVAVGGEGGVVAALPDPEHWFVRWSDHSTDNPRRDQNVSSNMTLRAEFMPRAAAVSRPRSDSSFTTTLSSSGAMGCSGLMSVDIAVDRVVGEIPKLVSSGAMGRTAELRIMGCSPGSNTYAVLWTGTGPEIKVGEVQLDGTWRVVRLAVPVEHIDFPADPGEGRSPTPAVNRLRLEPVGANENVAALTVSEVELKIEVAPPIFFVHGILSSAQAWEPMREYVNAELGLPTDAITMPDKWKLASIRANAAHVNGRVQMLKQRWGVDRMNIVAHSKGGLDAKHYTTSPDYQGDVYHLIQIATPNAGSGSAQRFRLFIHGLTRFSPWPTEALSDLTLSHMTRYNQEPAHQLNPSVIYRTIAGDYRVPESNTDAMTSWFCGGYRYSSGPGRNYPAVNGMAEYLRDEYRKTHNEDHAQAYADWVKPNDCWVTVDSAYALGTAYPGQLIQTAGADARSRHTMIQKTRDVYELIRADLIKSYRDPRHIVRATTVQAPVAISAEQKLRGSAQERNDYPGYLVVDEIGPLSCRSYEFWVSAGHDAMFRAVYLQDVDVPALNEEVFISVTDPSGVQWTNSNAGSGIVYEWEEEGGVDIRLESPTSGIWTVTVCNASAIHTNSLWLEMAGTDDGIEAVAQMATDSIRINEGPVGTVALTLHGAPVTNAHVVGWVRHSESTNHMAIAALDNGMWPDEMAQDGIYSFSFQVESEGVYDVILEARGNSDPVFMRQIELLQISVQDGGSSIGQVTGEDPVDMTGNGLYDELNLEIELHMMQAGEVQLWAALLDRQGEHITHANEQVAVEAGTSRVSMTFPGTAIYQTTANGPYVLGNVCLIRHYPSGSFVVLDRGMAGYETAAYSHREFEHGPFQQIGEADFEAVDSDADGLYDRLEVAMEMDAWDSLAGEYQWRAELVDGTGRRIAGVEGSCALGQDEDGRVILEIDGTVIGAAGINGPYHLVNLEFWQAGQLHIVFNPAGSSSFLPASGFNGYVPFPQETMDISVEHRADSFVLRWGSTTGMWYDIEYVPDPQDGGGEPLPHGMGIPANPPLNVWTQSWAGPSNHWYHYQVRPRRIP